MTKTHEIKLDGYGAHTTLAEDRPIMLLGTAESYGIEMLHVVPGKSWEELTITATFNAPDGTSTDMLMSAVGNITVPPEATNKSGSGRIVFTGVSEGVQRISCDLEYFVVAHSAINGVQSGGTSPSWFEQAVTRFVPAGGTAGQVLTKLTDTDFDAGWQDSQGGAGLAPLVGTTQTITPSQVLAAIKAGRDVALQHTDSDYGTFVFSAFNANEQIGIVVSNSILPQFNGLTGTLLGSDEDDGWIFRATNTATKDDVGTAVNEALAQAKASGEFDGADGLTPTIGDNGNWYLGDTDTGKPSRGDKGAGGKSAYQYAQDGGYTGTEAEFAAKLAQEKFASPNALTFTGAVTGSYDGSATVTVEIPSGGGSIATATKLHEITLEEEVTSISETLPFNPMDYKKIIVLCSFVTATTNTSKVQVLINLGGLRQWLPSWLNYNAVQKFHARCDYDIQSGLNMLTIYYSNNYIELSDTPLTFNIPRYNYTSNDLTNTFAVTTQNKYLGVGTKFEFWGIK